MQSRHTTEKIRILLGMWLSANSLVDLMTGDMTANESDIYQFVVEVGIVKAVCADDITAYLSAHLEHDKRKDCAQVLKDVILFLLDNAQEAINPVAVFRRTANSWYDTYGEILIAVGAIGGMQFLESIKFRSTDDFVAVLDDSEKILKLPAHRGYNRYTRNMQKRFARERSDVHAIMSFCEALGTRRLAKIPRVALVDIDGFSLAVVADLQNGETVTMLRGVSGVWVDASDLNICIECADTEESLYHLKESA